MVKMVFVDKMVQLAKMVYVDKKVQPVEIVYLAKIVQLANMYTECLTWSNGSNAKNGLGR